MTDETPTDDSPTASTDPDADSETAAAAESHSTTTLDADTDETSHTEPDTDTDTDTDGDGAGASDETNWDGAEVTAGHELSVAESDATAEGPDSDGDEGVPSPVQDDAAYEAQEWTLGDLRTGEIEVQGMKFKLEEPADDAAVERLLKQGAGVSDNLREVVDTLVVAPAITDERWEQGMTAKERALLAGEALDWFGINDFIDEEQLAEAMQQPGAGGPAGRGAGANPPNSPNPR